MTVLIDNLTPDKRPRHPEKANRPDSEVLRKPSWIRAKAPGAGPEAGVYAETKKIIKDNNLVTVCEEAACPNIGECWSQRHATMMIMGEICTRACAFCNVSTGMPLPLDTDEPARVADAVAKLGLRHIVITSVDRDDLNDGGAQHFADTIYAIRANSPETSIEILTPDFLRKEGALEIVVEARPDVFNHNLETIPRLYKKVRPGADYAWSLSLLKSFRQLNPNVPTKSGLMLGLGEHLSEVRSVMSDLRENNVDMVTLGQYLQPSKQHLKVERFVSPEEFDDLADFGRSLGFKSVASGPLVRSSYHADLQVAETLH